MLNNKKSFLIFAILIVLFSLTIVGAADNSNTTYDDTNIITSVADDTTNIDVKEETSNYEINEANSIKTTKKSIEKHNTTNTYTKTYTYKTVTNYTELVNEVNAAKSNEDHTYISLLPGDYNATATMNWNVTDNNRKLYIDGNGMTLDGNNTYLFMTNSYAYLILRNITFTNFLGIDVGGVISNWGGALWVENCNFINNYAPYYGGAINNVQGYVQVDNSTFTGNSANSGGALAGYGTSSYGDFIVNNCTFIRNHATYYGGVLHSRENSPFHITDSNFTDNTAIQGGVIFNNGTFEITGSIFENNAATNYGGAIYNFRTVNIENSYFNNNTATEYAGAIFNIRDGNLTVIDSNFTANTAELAGAILVDENATFNVKNSNFTNNVAFDGSGAIYVNGNGSVEGSTFENNNGTNGGGAIYIYYDGNLNVYDSTFTGNRASEGGSIDIHDGKLFVTGSNFTTTEKIEFGGSIYNSGGDVTVNDSFFTSIIENLENNTLISNDSSNEIINWNNSNGTPFIIPVGDVRGANSSEIEYYGGAIYNKVGNFIITESEFKNIYPTTYGGAIINNEGSLTVNSSNFTENSAMAGASILNVGGTLDVVDSEFKDNNATVGAGVSNENGTVTVVHSKFSDNNALSGASIYHIGGTLTVSDSTFENNSGDAGAGIYSEKESTITVNNSNFTNNVVTIVGGAIRNNATLNINNCQFTGNAADNDFGGAICNYVAGVLKVVDSTFTDNSAKTFGGAIFNLENETTIIRSTFLNNTLKGNESDGAAIFNFRGIVNVSSSEFINNTASRNGTIYDLLGIVNTDNSTFAGNSPEYFVIENRRIKTFKPDSFMTSDVVSIYLDDDQTPVYTGPYYNYKVPLYHTLRLKDENENVFILDPVLYHSNPHSYDELVNAVNQARNSTEDTYLIQLLPGDYNATSAMTWDNNRTVLVIDGNGLVLEGKDRIRFMEVKNGSSLILNNITLTNYNVGGQDGAVLRITNANIFINSSNFIANYAARGGVIAYGTYYGDVNISNSYFINNSANSLGGAIYNLHNLNVADSYFINNKVEYPNNYDSDGGAIYNYYSEKNTITNTTFINNTAFNGGAIGSKRWYEYGKVTTVTGCTFINNTATNSGGAIFANYYDVIENSNFIGNTPYCFVIGNDNTLILYDSYNEVNTGNESVDICINDNKIRKSMTDGVVDNFVLPVGSYNLSIVVVESIGSSTTIKNNTYMLDPIVNDLTLSVDDVTCEYSENVPVTVSTTPKVINADVSISIGGDVVATAVVDNVTDTIVVDVDTTGYSSGIYTLNVLYTDAITGYTTSTTSQLTIVSTKTSITFNPVYDVKYNTNVTISGLLQNSEGNVLSNQIVELRLPTKTVNVLTDNRGMFNYTTVFKNTGDQTVTAIFAGTETFKASIALITFTVNKQDTQITIDEISNLYYNENIIITGNLSDKYGNKIENADLELIINDKITTIKTNSNGKFTYTTKATNTGRNNLTIKFLENENYKSSNITKYFNVLKLSTNIELYTLKPATIGTTIKISGKLLANNTGVKDQSVTINIDGQSYSATTFSSGYFTINYTPTNYNTQTILFTYNGNTYYESSSNTTTLTVKKPTNIELYTLKPATKDTTIKISGKLLTNNSGVKDQTVTINIDGQSYSATTYSSGYFTINYTPTNYNTQTITFTYNGNTYYESSSNTTTLTVKQPTNIELYALKPVVKGTTIKISGKLLTNNMGVKGQTVTININGQNYTTTTYSSGYFTINYTVNTYQPQTVTFMYNGNTYYESSTNTTTLTVKQPTNIELYALKPVVKGTTIKISGKLLTNNTGVKGQTIKILVNQQEFTATTLSSGYFTINYTTSIVGTNNVTFTYDGNANYIGTNNSFIFTVKS